jgi:hypothetical protein
VNYAAKQKNHSLDPSFPICVARRRERPFRRRTSNPGAPDMLAELNSTLRTSAVSGLNLRVPSAISRDLASLAATYRVTSCAHKLVRRRSKPVATDERSVEFSSLAYRERPGLMCGDEVEPHGDPDRTILDY